jgi:hypothetical protein
VAAVVFIAWCLGALLALARPRYQRRLVALGIVISLAAVPLGVAFSGRPQLRVLVLLIGLGLPGLLAPTPDREAPHNRLVAVGTGLLLLAVLLPWSASLSHGLLHNGPIFSVLQMFRLSHYLPYVAVTGVVVAGGLTLSHRREWLGAGLLVTAPWFAAGALTPSPYARPNGVDAAILVMIAVWLGVSWDRDRHGQQLLRRSTSSG